MKGFRLFASLCFFSLLLCTPVQAAEPIATARTEVTLTTDLATVTPSRPFWALLHIKLKDGWHTYWKNPGDSGTPPILTWTLPSGFKAGDMEFIAPERLKTGPLMDYGYNNDAYYLIPIKPPTLVNENATIIIMLKAQWLVCKDVCIPEKGEFALTMPVTPAHTDPKPTADAALIDSVVKRLPMPIAEPMPFRSDSGIVKFDIKLPKVLGKTPAEIQFFPAVDGVISNTAEQVVNVAGDVLSFSVAKGESTDVTQWSGVVSLIDGAARSDYAVNFSKDAPAITTASTSAQAPESISLLPAILAALLGGLILNLMPCVLPILSLKILSVAKKAKSHASVVRRQALAYTAGVVLSFMLLAVLLLVLQALAGSALGWGFQMQSPVFVSFLAVLMFLVGMNLSGVFELPVLFGNVGAEKAAEDSAVGSFFTGVLAVLVATPCTAPFMAPAIGFALTQSTPVVLTVFAALGLGLAAPFLLLSLFPSFAALLPRPGAWMLTLRQFLAFPVYLTVVWLLWVLASEAGPNGVAVAMLAMLAAGFCLFLFARESLFARLLGVVLALATVAGVVQYVEAMPAGKAAQPANTVAYSPEKLAELRSKGTPVFVDATADWCITCKVNEAVALDKPEVKAEFAKRGIVMMVADWTHGDMEITQYLRSFDRSGVPIYVYYPPQGEPKVLPQLLTPSIVIDAVGEAPAHE